MIIKEIVEIARQQNGLAGEVYLRGRLVWSGDLRNLDRKYQNYKIKYNGFNDSSKSVLLYL